MAMMPESPKYIPHAVLSTRTLITLFFVGTLTTADVTAALEPNGLVWDATCIDILGPNYHLSSLNCAGAVTTSAETLK